MRKLYLIMIALAGFALQASAGVTYTMLSATKTGGNEGAEKLLDGQGSTKWGETLNNGNSRWIVFKASAGILPSDYVLTVANDTPGNQGRQWKKWRIYGANFINDFSATRDASGWVLLDSKQDITDEQFPTGSSNQSYLQTTFSLSEGCSTFYEYFKIEVDEIRQSGQYMQMGDFAFGTYTEQTTAELYGVKVNMAKNLDMTGLDESDVWSREAPVIIGGLDEAYANAQNSGDYSALQSSLDVAVKLSTGIARLVSNGNISAFDGSACWGDGHYTQLFDGKDGISPNEGTKWGGNFSGEEGSAEHVQYVIFRVKEAFAPYFYKLVTGGDTGRFNGRNWKTWSVYGANFASIADATKDAEGWVELDKRENISEEYLPMKSNYPATFNFLSGVSEPYLYYMVKVFAAHNGNQTQMNEMYLCTQEEFEAARTPLVAYFDDFDLDALVTEDGLDEDKTAFAEKMELLKETSDAVEMTKLYNELVALRAKLEESAAFVAGGYRPLDGNTKWGDNENWTKLVDGDTSTKWGGDMPSGGSYVIFKTYEGNTFGQYMLVTGNDTKNSPGRNWKTWKIYGSNAADDASATRDATDWVLLDQKADIGQDRLPADNFTQAFFNFSEEWAQGYKYFKIEVEAAYNGGSIQMSEFKMLSDEAYAAIRQEYLESLQAAAGKVLADAGVEVPASLMQQLLASPQALAFMTAEADELLSKYNEALSYVNTLPAVLAVGVPAQVDGVYQIANAMQLVYFGAVVNSGEPAANAVVVADIDLAETNGMLAWTAIGTPDVAYSGSFDGQGHAITNFEGTTPVATGKFGLFGNVNEATIENFSIAGSLTVPAGAANGSGVVGWAVGSTVSNIYSTLVINVGGENAKHVGGVVGSAQNGANTITNCAFAGSMTVEDGSHDCFGGIVGYMSADKVMNCANYGTIDYYAANCYIGGITGYINNEGPTVANCLNIGAVTYKGEGSATYGGAIVGRLRKDVPNIKNNYWLEGSAVASCGEKALASPAVTSVTAEQLASGEVAYLLNGKTSDGDLAWFQTLDEPKVYLAEQYVATINGSQKAPRTADVTLSENGDGTYTFMLTDLVISVMGQELTVGDISLDGVVVNDDGTFSKEGTYDVPDENIPNEYAMLKPYFKNLPYTLSGKVNNDKLYAVIDITLNIAVTGTTYAINVEAGVDDFEAVAPALTSDLYPVLDATHGIVYPVGQVHCDGTPYEDVTYSNNPAESTQDDHNFVDGFCTYCGACIMTPNEDGIYEISTAEELVMFAQIVNKGAYDADAILTADIDMTDADITKFPIGSITDATAGRYVGTFDGQFHKISNFKLVNPSAPKNYGMFNTTTGVVLKNFWLDSSCEIEGTEVVSLIGRHDGGGTFECIGNFANVTGKNNNIGGLFGGIFGNSSDKKNVYITNCWSAGKVTSTNTSASNYKDCGALSGWINNAKVTINNFWTIAEVVNYKSASTYIIRSGGGASFTANGCYSLYGAENQEKVAFTPITEEQVESGELTYMLGSVWRQTIGTDETPVLDPAHGIVNKITEVGYATQYIVDTDVTIPTGVQAFTGEIESTWLKLNALDGVIAAGEPVVLKGAAGFYSFIPTTGATKVEGNVLKGADEEIPAEGLYVLAKPDEASPIGFYLADSGTIKAGKAYLEDASGVKAFFFEGDEATGIANVGNAVEDGLIYNLAGQRVGKMQKGINIVNGKKVLY